GLAPLKFLAKMGEGSVPQGVSNVVANYRRLAAGAELRYHEAACTRRPLPWKS
ncbi:MAG: transposase, partial [Thermoanaerobaculum sp.]